MGCGNVIWCQAVALSISTNFMELSALQMKTGKAMTKLKCLDIMSWIGYVMRTICLAYIWKLQIYLTMYTLKNLFLIFRKQTMRIMTNLLNGTAVRFVP